MGFLPRPWPCATGVVVVLPVCPTSRWRRANLEGSKVSPQNPPSPPEAAQLARTAKIPIVFRKYLGCALHTLGIGPHANVFARPALHLKSINPPSSLASVPCRRRAPGPQELLGPPSAHDQAVVSIKARVRRARSRNRWPARACATQAPPIYHPFPACQNPVPSDK